MALQIEFRSYENSNSRWRKRKGLTMARIVHTFDNPQRFVAGTVGVPGERTFFLQARTDQRIV